MKILIPRTMLKKQLRSRKILIIFLLTTACVILNSMKATNRNFAKRDLLNKQKSKNQECVIPNLDPFSQEVIIFDTEYIGPVTCDGKDWVSCYHSKCKVIPEVLNNVKHIACIYNDIIYDSDRKYHLGLDFIVLDGGSYTLENSDHVKISCTGVPKSKLMKAKWKGYSSGFRSSVEQKPVPPGREHSFNLLIFGFHSTSKNGFIRSMPKSYKYLTEVMEGTVLNGYNILGDGTAQSLFPILTGWTEMDVSKKMSNTSTLDMIPFIFSKLKEDGYRTSYFEDLVWAPNGFRSQPADHYLRSFFLEEKSGNWWNRLQNPYCVGSTPQFKFMMNITDQFLRLDGKKFIFTFISDITHGEFKRISSADDDMVKLLESLVARGLENTVVMILGDHGVRYAKVRNTFQGRLETRLPLMYIRLPEQLKRRRPNVESVLRANTKVLTTPHDIHATILDVLGMTEYINNYKVPGYDVPRAMSLLYPIPKDRSCSAAGVAGDSCACLTWQNVSQNDIMYRKAVNAFLDYVNLLTEKVRKICEYRPLLEVIWVMRQNAILRPMSEVKLRKKYWDFVIFDEHVKKAVQNYHIKIALGPKRAVYEASLQYLVDEDNFSILGRDISKTNDLYAVPTCTSEKWPHLNPYCSCIDYVIHKLVK